MNWAFLILKDVKIVSFVHLASWWSCIGNGLRSRLVFLSRFFCLTQSHFIFHCFIQNCFFCQWPKFCWHRIYDVWTNHAYHGIWYKLWFASFDSTHGQNCKIIMQPKQVYYITITVYSVHDILWSVLVTKKTTLLIQWKIMKDWRKMKITNDQLSKTLFWPGSKLFTKETLE